MTINGSYWEPSETLNYIRTNLREGRIYSNNAYLTWWWDRDRTAALGRHKFLPWFRKLMPLIMRWPDDAHIVWLQNERAFYAYDALDIRCLPGVETVAELSDGVVFRVTTAEPFDADRHRACKQRYAEQLIQQAGDPVVRAGWDVYRKGRKLIYFKEPCTRADVQAKFVLHVTPADPEDLARPADLSEPRRRYDYDNLGFYFDRRGLRVGDQCIATAPLPGYPIGRIRVGQWIANGNRTLWDAAFSPGR